jgi:hypothetical protein
MVYLGAGGALIAKKELSWEATAIVFDSGPVKLE